MSESTILGADIRQRLAAHRVIASVSGGKDSAAVCLYLKEQGIPYEAVFMDTGWEHADTYAYLRGDLTEAIGPITWLRAEVTLPPEREAMAQELEAMLGHYSAMVRLCLHKMMMPARQVRWCTQASKVEPIRRYLDGLDADTLSVVGIRSEESEARKAMAEWEWSDKEDRWTWRPIIRWSLDEVIAIHTRHSLRPNPLYLRGWSRVGCWPCIFARKAEIKMLADIDPARIEVIRRLEAMISDLYRTTKVGSEGKRAARAARAAWWACSDCDTDLPNEAACSCGGERVYHEAVAAQLYQPPTWFQHNSQRTEAMRTEGYAWPIDRVVEWSKTTRGGRQFELFASTDRDAGCMRWGLCDTGDPAAKRGNT